MDIETIYDIIERNRKLNERSSLPLYFKDEDIILWFNYIVEYEKFTCKSTNIFIANISNNSIKKIPKKIEIQMISTEQNNETMIDEEDYYMKLNKNTSLNDLFDLISKSDEAPFLLLYKNVATVR